MSMISFAYDTAILYNNSTYKGIGTGFPLSLLSQLYGMSHILFFRHKKTPDPGQSAKTKSSLIQTILSATELHRIMPKKGSLAYALGAHSR